MTWTGELLARASDAVSEDGMQGPAAIRARGARRTRRQVGGGVLAAALVVAVGLTAAAARHPDRTPAPAQEDQQTLQGWSLTSTTEVPGLGDVASGAGSLWVVDEAGMATTDGQPDGATYEVSPDGPQVEGVAQQVAGSSPLVAHGAVWELVQGGLDQVVRLDVRSGSSDRRPASADAATPVGAAATDAGVFVANAQTGTISRLDPTTGALLAEERVAGRNVLDSLASDGEHLFVLARHDLLVIDATRLEVVGRVSLGEPTHRLTVDGQHVYVVTRADHVSVVDVSDPAAPRVTEETQVYTRFDSDVAALTVTGGFLWLAMWDTESLVQVDLATLQTVGSYHLPLERYASIWPASMVAAHGALWVRVEGELLEFRPR